MQTKTALLYFSLTAVLFPIVTSCTTQKHETPPEQCTGHGTGLSVAPTESTKAASAAQDAAAKLTIDQLHGAVGRGDTAAIVELGLRHVNGTSITQDSEAAVKYFRISADQGNPIGLFYLGTALANGVGLPKEESMAVFFWEQAAQQGYGMAQYWLGFFIANGRGGIGSNWCAAAPLFEAAAADNVTDAAFMLGVMYQEGRGVEPNYDKAAGWYRKANAIEFNQKAQYNLRFMIERYQIEWQPGDPGAPPPPKEWMIPKGENAPKLELKDNSAANVG